MISVVIPLYNKEGQIAHTLQSVFTQTFQNFEIVVVDDGSTDNSVEEVERFDDSRIRLIHQTNAGVSAARNRGIEEASGELIAFLDADDVWMPEYLATQYGLYQKYPECSVYACNYEIRDFEGKVTPTIIRKLPFEGEDGILSNYFEVASCSHPPICSISIMVKKTAIQAIGGFPLGIKSGEDLLTWARLAVVYRIAYTKIVQARFLMNRVDVCRPKRSPDKEDYVGRSLIKLYHQNQKEKKFKEYISSYYKGRALHAIECSLMAIAFMAVVCAIRYNYKNYKNYLLLCICVFPRLYFRKRWKRKRF